MHNFAVKAKDSLLRMVDEFSTCSYLFSINPKIDFTRSRKLNLKTLVHMFLTMEERYLSKELLEYFKYDMVLTNVSLFNHQRKKLLPKVFEFLLQSLGRLAPTNNF